MKRLFLYATLLVSTVCAWSQTNSTVSNIVVTVSSITVTTNADQSVSFSATLAPGDWQAMAHWAATPRMSVTDALTRVPTNGTEVVAVILGRDVTAGRRHQTQAEQNAAIQKLANRLKNMTPAQLQAEELRLESQTNSPPK
jgi:hypothetical protein